MKIIHPRTGDVLPLPLEFESFDPEWCWIFGNAILIAGGAHGIVILLRLVRWGEMPPFWIHRLLQHVLKECRQRGFKRWMSWLANDVYEEQKLFEIARKYGAQVEPFRGDLVLGVI
jgi:hypothetical protein